MKLKDLKWQVNRQKYLCLEQMKGRMQRVTQRIFWKVLFSVLEHNNKIFSDTKSKQAQLLLYQRSIFSGQPKNFDLKIR